MAATQQRTKLCCRTDLEGPLGLISVENGLRVPIACGRVPKRMAYWGEDNGRDATRVGYGESASFGSGVVRSA